eukprot:TRINITY_DN5350_c0_g1_i1.p1 TRINITY_DN5350_c0_g1~~TRINITY_DN5350_c0_g1_i1.p1  ORF type:complete len:438 (+),score=64.20 TRINITY_DN5350_c0_g1_i1:213-1526(+)
MVGAPVLGFWYNHRQPAEVFCLSLILIAIGSLVYAFAAPFDSLILLHSSRFVVGTMSASIAPCRAHIAAWTDKSERLRYLGYLGAAQYVGFAVAPGLASPFGLIDTQVWFMPINQLTLPGIFLFFGALVFVPVLYLMLSKRQPASETLENHVSLEPHQAALDDAIDGDSDDDKYSDATQMTLLGRQSTTTTITTVPINDKSYTPVVESDIESPTNDVEAEEPLSERLVLLGLGTYIVLNFLARGLLATLETFVAPIFISLREDDDNVADVGEFLLALGLFGLVFFFAIGYLNRLCKEQTLLVISFVFIAVGSVLLSLADPDLLSLSKDSLIPFSLFVAGCTLFWSIGSPICQTVIISSYSTLLGSAPQGTMMGWIAFAASLGRITLPMSVAALPDWAAFMTAAMLAVVSAILVAAYGTYVKWAHARNTNVTMRFVVG